MVKSVFIGYMGTTADERSTEMLEIVLRICKNVTSMMVGNMMPKGFMESINAQFIKLDKI